MESSHPLLVTTKTILKTLALALKGLGLDVRKLIFLKYLPRYIKEYSRFKNMGGKVSLLYPILTDYDDNAGSANGHYFHQDLLVATFIHQANPKRHIDIGSRIDGFVAHVAAFRKIEVFDLRKLDDTGHRNIVFFQADLMQPNNAYTEITDSLSCLHALEHFGLGRYGDPIDPLGHIKGFNNIIKMLKRDGTLYISFPIATITSVQFNGLRLFNPTDVLSWPTPGHQIELDRFDYVDDVGNLHQKVDVRTTPLNVSNGCGIYTFHKIE